MNNTAKVIIIAILVIAAIIGAWFGLRAVLNGVSSLFAGRGGVLQRIEKIGKHVNTEFETAVYTPGERFDSIKVKGADCDVRFEKSSDGKCFVECPECEGVTHSVEISDGTLVIERVIDQKIYGTFHIVWHDEAIIVTLPEDEYDRLTVENSSGNIDVPAVFGFESAKLKCSSGDIAFEAAVEEELDLKATSGNIMVRGADCEKLTAETTSGSILMYDCRAEKIRSSSTSGNFRMENCFGDEIGISCTSGNISLKACDGGDIEITSTSGEVEAELLSGKEFSCKATSGDVDVPDSVKGNGTCRIRTTSGDIEVRIVR